MKAPKRKRAAAAGKPLPESPAPMTDLSAGQNYCTRSEPELLIAAQEAVKFLDTAHVEIRGIRARLFREQLSFGAPCGANERVTLEGLIRRLSTDAACLVGELRTIAGKLG